LLGFFEQDAETFIEDWKKAGVNSSPSRESLSYIEENIKDTQQGERNLLVVQYAVPQASFTTVEKWEKYIDTLLKNKSWAWLSGYDVLYKITMTDMLGNVRLARGKNPDDVMVYCEPLHENVQEAKDALAVAIDDLKAASVPVQAV